MSAVSVASCLLSWLKRSLTQVRLYNAATSVAVCVEAGLAALLDPFAGLAAMCASFCRLAMQYDDQFLGYPLQLKNHSLALRLLSLHSVALCRYMKALAERTRGAKLGLFDCMLC